MLKILAILIALAAAAEAATYRVSTTAYCACTRCCGPQARGVTASGRRPIEGTTVAANWLPIGTLVSIQGFRVPKRVEDRMASRFHGRLDIYFRNHREALRFGKRQLTVTVQ